MKNRSNSAAGETKRLDLRRRDPKDWRFLVLASVIAGLLILLTQLVAPMIGDRYAVERPIPVRPPLWRLEESEWLKGLVPMVALAGGTFQMGSEDGEPDERPVHAVTVASFSVSRAEITVGQYQACYSDGVCPAPENSSGDCNWGRQGRQDHPMNCVTWEEARTFAAWLGARLPTEAEWEFAARSGGGAWEYPWGGEPPDCTRAVIRSDAGLGCGRGSTLPVCSLPAGNTEQGLCDLAGNVWEWVQDDWQPSYEGASADGNRSVSLNSSTKAFRGGSWKDTSSFARAAFRNRWTLDGRYSFIGFRVVRFESLARQPSGRGTAAEGSSDASQPSPEVLEGSFSLTGDLAGYPTQGRPP